MSNATRTLRIFISSPGDVSEERAKARRVIETLERQYPQVKLQPVLWEDLALPATASFQESIDLLLHRERIDVAIFIIWSRLGSQLGQSITRPDGTPYRSGTEREFDLMLAAYEQSGKERPVILAYMRRDESGFRQRLTTSPSAKLEELIEQRKLAESFVKEHFLDDDGRNFRAYHSYPEPVSFAQRLHTHLRNILDEQIAGTDVPRWLESPYRGLEFFDTQHAAIFHGRDEEICSVLQRFRDQDQAGCPFVVIVGASGSGKSSLARAGVAAMLVDNGYDETVRLWKLAAFLPSLAENGNLLTGLTRSLALAIPTLASNSTQLQDIAKGLATDPELTIKLSFDPVFEQLAAQASGRVRVLVLLDQMEELWTDRNIAEEARTQFFRAVRSLAASGHIAFLATLRSDFYAQAQQQTHFLELKGENGQFDLLPPGPAAIQKLIVEPARLAGLTFERNPVTGKTLDEVILQHASHDASALPLIQYALSELYDHRDQAGHMLTFAAYDELGGVEGAVANRANAVFERLSSQARTSLEEVLPLLVTIDIGGEEAVVRRRARLSEMTDTPAKAELSRCLIEARFLTSDRHGEESVVSLAHEALLRRWDKIADWVKIHREHLRLRTRVEQNLHRWQLEQQELSLLLSPGLPLEEGRRLLYHAALLLDSGTKNYIEKSIRQEAELRGRKRRIRNIVVASLAALSMVSMLGGITALFQRNEAKRFASEAISNELKAITQSRIAETNAQKADEQAQLAKKNEQLAQKSEQLAQQSAQLAQEKQEQATRLLTVAKDYMSNAFQSANNLFSATVKSNVLKQQYAEYLRGNLAHLDAILLENPDATWALQLSAYNYTQVADQELDLGHKELSKEYATKALTQIGLLKAAPPDPETDAWLVRSAGILASTHRRLGEIEMANTVFAFADDAARSEAESGKPAALLRLALVYQVQAEIQGAQQDWESALLSRQESIKLFDRILQDSPDDFRAMEYKVDDLKARGILLLKVDRKQEAIDELNEAVRQMGRIANARANESFEVVIPLRNKLGDICVTLGDAYLDLKDLEEARRVYRNLLSARRGTIVLADITLSDEIAYDSQFSHSQLASALVDCGYMEYEIGDMEIGETYYLEAEQIYLQLAADIPSLANRKNHARSLLIWGHSFNHRKEWEKAAEKYAASLEIRSAIAKSFPDESDYQKDVAVLYKHIADMETKLRQYDKAVKLVDERLRIRRELFSAVENADSREELVSALGSAAFIYLFVDDDHDAIATANEALQLSPDENWIKANLAVGLLMADRIDEAQKIYSEICLLRHGEQMMAEACLQDIDDLRKAGRERPAMAEIEVFLKQQLASVAQTPESVIK